MHGSTLSEYWRNENIPRGWLIQKAPIIGKLDELDESDENFIKRWGEILNKCSLDLMLLIIKQVSNEAHELKTEIQAQEEFHFGADFSAIDQALKDITNIQI